MRKTLYMARVIAVAALLGGPIIATPRPWQDTTQQKAAAVKDPVCGMEVDPKNPKTLKVQRDGKAHYFCSDHCRKSFESDPGKYTGKK